MQKFETLTGVAAPIEIDNVDTDMIIPKQYLKTIKRTGLGAGLFAEMRYLDDGSPNPDFVLNKPAYKNVKILVAGDNFGCGSTGEPASAPLAVRSGASTRSGSTPCPARGRSSRSTSNPARPPAASAFP